VSIGRGPLIAALRIVLKHSDYHLFENNCQNFARYLVEKISPGSCCPKTIKDVLEEWTAAAILATDHDSDRQLPGAWPPSTPSTSTESGTYFTAQEDTYEDTSPVFDRRLMSRFLNELGVGI